MDHKTFINLVAAHCIEAANDIHNDLRAELGDTDVHDLQHMSELYYKECLAEEVLEAIDLKLRTPLDELTFDQMYEAHARCFSPDLRSAYYSRRVARCAQQVIYVCLLEDETAATGFAACELIFWYGGSKLQCDYVQCTNGEILEPEQG